MSASVLKVVAEYALNVRELSHVVSPTALTDWVNVHSLVDAEIILLRAGSVFGFKIVMTGGI